MGKDKSFNGRNYFKKGIIGVEKGEKPPYLKTCCSLHLLQLLVNYLLGTIPNCIKEMQVWGNLKACQEQHFGRLFNFWEIHRYHRPQAR